MTKIDSVIKHIQEMNDNSCDINTKKIIINNKEVAIIYFESTSSDDKISNYLGKSLSNDVKNKKKNLFENLLDYFKNTIPNSKITIVSTYDDAFYYLSSGYTIIAIENSKNFLAIETKNKLDRSITETTSEPALKGPKDSFIENYQINIGLIRKRIKDPNLIFSETKIGRRTKTKIAVTYIKDIVDIKKVNKLKNELKKIDIDGILDSSYIRELIVEKQKSIMPQVILTERPDLVSVSLLNGKIAVIVENTPYVLIMPALFSDFFESPEDYYSKPLNASFSRVLRYFAFFIAIIVPGFYIAVTTYNMEVIPDLLLISFAIQKEGVPFPTLIEVLILISAYEILREADTRKPKVIGASISIVGALILGESAVNAGIISPIVVIVISLSAVSGMVFSDSDVINAIREWRLVFMLASCLFGLIGLFIILVLFLIKLCSIESFGVPFSAPLAPFYIKDFKRNIFRFSEKNLKERPAYLTDNLTRLRSDK